MINLHDIRYVRLGTPDIESAETFARDMLGLQVSRRENGAVYFRSDLRDHTLCYFEGDPTDHTSAFQVLTSDELEAGGALLDREGYAVREGTKEECEQRRVKRFIEFKDPTGNKIELVLRPEANSWPIQYGRPAGLDGFSHIGLCTTDPQRDEAFWTKLLSARVSDWIGDAPLLRIDEIHHKIALFPTTHAGVQHVNHQVHSIDDIMRAYYFLREKQVRIVFGPGRHPTSGAIFLYFEGPDGMVYEYSTGVSHITDEEGHVARQFPFHPDGFCIWGSKPDIAEFKT